MKVYVSRGSGFFVVLHKARKPTVEGEYTVLIYIEPPSSQESNKGKLYIANNQHPSNHETMENHFAQPGKVGAIGHKIIAPGFDAGCDTGTSIGYEIHLNAADGTVSVTHYGASRAYTNRRVVAKGITGLESVRYVGVLPGSEQNSAQVHVQDARISRTRLAVLTPANITPDRIQPAPTGKYRPRNSSVVASKVSPTSATSQLAETVWQWYGDNRDWHDQTAINSQIIEEAYLSKQALAYCKINSMTYIIDLKENMQYMETTPRNKREVRRIEGTNSSGGAGAGLEMNRAGSFRPGGLGPAKPPRAKVAGKSKGGGAASAGATAPGAATGGAPVYRVSVPAQWQFKMPKGWTPYHKPDNATIEAAWTTNAHSARFSIPKTGAVYIVDFKSRTHWPEKNPTARRQVRRFVPGESGAGGGGQAVWAPVVSTPAANATAPPVNEQWSPRHLQPPVGGGSKKKLSSSSRKLSSKKKVLSSTGPKRIVPASTPVPASPPNVRWQVMLESGWTDFPPESNAIIVAAVRNGSTQAVVTARGIEYVVDTQVLTQFQKGDSSRQREIRCVSNADTGAGADAGAALDSANSSWLHGAITPVHNQPYRRPARVIESPSDGDGDADSIGGFGEVPVFDMTVEAPRDESPPPPPPPPPPDDDSSVGVGAGEASAGAGVLLHTKHSAMAGVHEEFSDYVEMARISELPPPTVQPTPPTPPPPAQQQQQQQQQAARGAASTAGSGNGGSGLELGVSNRPPMNKDAASAVLAWGASVAAETPEHLPGTVGQ